MKLSDLTGETFGMLRVISRAENTPSGRAQWNCRCECGATCVVRGDNLKQGKQRSCGNHMTPSSSVDTWSPNFAIVEYIGPEMGFGLTYGFVECFDVAGLAQGDKVSSGKLLWRSPPANRQSHATRGATWLAQQSLTRAQNNDTFRRWMNASRTVIRSRGVGTAADVNHLWCSREGRADIPPIIWADDAPTIIPGQVDDVL